MSADNSHAETPITVLLVDDEIYYVNVLANRLSKRRITTTKAFSGTEAIQALRRQDFDVVILDLKLEDMDGIEVLKIMKKMDPDVNVIMLTGHGSEQAAKDGITEGAFDYLTKPCELSELIGKIREAHAARSTGVKSPGRAVPKHRPPSES